MAAELRSLNGRTALYVNGEFFLALGGETHNSSASSPEWMEEKVWPVVRTLGLNTLLVPVYWELIEPKEGCFDFSSVDLLLAQARREKVHLVLLWFGLWKNALSTYAPAWVKEDRVRFFRAGLFEQLNFYRSRPAISPCCKAAVAADAAAFAALMAHLKAADETTGTVLFVQVENEVGLLGSDRDYSPAAEALFHAPVPVAVAEHFNVTGTWEEAFSGDACAQFMAWCFASALEKIAAAGKLAYPLPLYTNAWTVQYENEREGSWPTGGPVLENWPMWQLAAPSLDWLSPDIYKPDFGAECRHYAQGGTPLFIPEAKNHIDAATNLLYAVAGCCAFGFSPFAIEDIGGHEDLILEGIYQQQCLNERPRENTLAPHYLREAVALLRHLAPHLPAHWGTPTLQAFQFTASRYAACRLDGYEARITFLPPQPSLPLPGGLVLQTAKSEFLIAGLLAEVEFLPARGERKRVEYLQLEEGHFDQSGSWHTDQICNGDEHRILFTNHFRLIKATLTKA